MGNVEYKKENLFPFEIIADIFELTEWEILSIIFNNNYFRFRPPSSFFPPTPLPEYRYVHRSVNVSNFHFKMKIWSGVGRKKWNAEFHLKNMTWINLIIFLSLLFGGFFLKKQTFFQYLITANVATRKLTLIKSNYRNTSRGHFFLFFLNHS